jgi:hypothetical protein
MNLPKWYDLQSVNIDLKSHSEISKIIAYLVYRLGEWLIKEGPELLRGSRILIAAMLVVLAAIAKSTWRWLTSKAESAYRWLQETDWELMVNRIFPRKKGRPKLR